MRSFLIKVSILMLLAACTQVPLEDPQLGVTADDYVIERLFSVNDVDGIQDMSADGKVILGTKNDQPFIWTKTGGFKTISAPSGTQISGVAISADGTTVVGSLYKSNGDTHAFRWRSATGVTDIGALPTSSGLDYSVPTHVSADGNVVVGCSNETYDYEAFRWTAAGGMKSLAPLSEGFQVEAISSDGSVVIGVGLDEQGLRRVLKWTSASGLQKFPIYTSLSPSSGCRNFQFYNNNVASANGSVIVGLKDVQPARWTSSTTPTLLPVPSDINETYRHTVIVSGNGLVSAGSIEVFRNGEVQNRFLRWTGTSSPQDLTPSGPRPSVLLSDISFDGNVIIGGISTGPNDDEFGTNPMVWTSASGVQYLDSLDETSGGFADILSDDGNTIVGQSGLYFVRWVRNTGTKQNQTVTLTSTPPTSAKVGGSYTVSATASSGLAVSFSSTTTSVCTVSGNTVRFVAAGSCVINANQSGNAQYNPAPKVTQTISVAAGTATYTIDSTTLTAGSVITSVAKGRGITSTGSVTGNVSVLGLRKGKTGNVAMVQGTNKFLILSSNGVSQTPNATGGTLTFGFGSFGTGKVTVKTIKLNGTTKTGGTVKVYNGTTLLKSVAIPQLGSGVNRVLTFDTANVNKVVVTLVDAGKVDDLVVTQ